jgi:hypothetical protein
MEPLRRTLLLALLVFPVGCSSERGSSRVEPAPAPARKVAPKKAVQVSAGAYKDVSLTLTGL